MKKRISMIAFMIILSGMLLSGCSGFHALKDGYYTAEMSEYDSNGWKEYLCIQVKHGLIVSAEFNAKNKSGFIKAWDNSYMKNMMTVQGTYPNRYTREYVQQLMNEQRDIQVDTVTGASHSGSNFEKLVDAALKQAKSGNSKKVIVNE